MDDLEKHVRRVCDLSDVNVLEFSGEPDHVHILLELHPNIMPSKLVNSIKTVSSRMIRKDHWEHIKKMLWKDRFWSRSYCLIRSEERRVGKEWGWRWGRSEGGKRSARKG